MVLKYDFLPPPSAVVRATLDVIELIIDHRWFSDFLASGSINLKRVIASGVADKAASQ